MMASPARSDVDELTEKEWREMRRRMPSLQFEPVPETPELLPRSCYGNDDTATTTSTGDVDSDAATPVSEPSSERPVASSIAAVDDSVATTEEGVEAALAWPVSTECTATGTTANTSRTPAKAAALSVFKQPKSATAKRTVASPIKKPRRRASGSETPAEPTVTKPPLDLADLETTITAAQSQLRGVLLSAVEEITSRATREAVLDRRKLEAAHANQIALLQSQIKELQINAQTNEQRLHGDAQLLERVTRLMMKWKQREQQVWRHPRSLHGCFQAWKLRYQRKKQKHTQEDLASHFLHKQRQQILLQQWKLMTQQTSWEKKLHSLEETHRVALESIAAQHTTQMEVLQQELEIARQNTTVAEQARQQLEGDLRQVFLRGVSAMNIEALTLFKANHPIARQVQQVQGQEHPRLGGRGPSHPAEPTDHSMTMITAPPSTGGGESSEELPSEERMIPIKQPTAPMVMVDDPRVSLQSLLGPQVPRMPSSAIANRMLKNAGTDETLQLHHVQNAALPPPPTAIAHGLRSAELVEAHQRFLHATETKTRQDRPQLSGASQNKNQAASSSASLRSVSPAKQRANVQSSTQFHVEMEYLRSSVSTAAMNGARFGTSTTTTSSNGPSRSGHHGGGVSLGVRPSTLSTTSSSRRFSSSSSLSSTSSVASKSKYRSP